VKVPFLELKPTYLELKEELDAAYHRVMDSGWYLLGRELEAFEAEYAAFCEVPHCVAVGSGLDAISLALRACGVGAGDEVIVPSHTFIATWLAVSHVGAKVVPVECDPRTYNLDPNRVEAAITRRAKAIIPVHLYGQPADVDPLMELAARHNLHVIEDAAQAQGARYRDRRTGGLGHIAAHSFYPGKNLGAFGDAGAVTTHDTKLAEKVLLLRNYGSREKYHHEIKGYNSRVDELHAAFLRIKLAHLDEWNDRRCRLAGKYLEQLSGLPDLVLPSVPNWVEPVWHLFVIRHAQRDALQRRLAERGVGTLIHYPVPPHLSQAYADSSHARASLPVAEELAATLLSLPIGPHVTDEQVAQVVESIEQSIGETKVALQHK
jgi:dTDP-4-amino-4,6-dideoxygalactose transaminase